MSTTKIILAMCTYNRNELLKNALSHIMELNLPENCQLEIAIVDNNPENARCVVEQFADSKYAVHYFTEEKASIAGARNKSLKEAINLNAEYIAMMDDDAYPDSDWLLNLYNTLIKYNADAATSYQLSSLNGKIIPPPFHIKRRKTGQKRPFCITNSVLFKSSIVTELGIWFDEDYGLMTGEDIDFFDRAGQKGCNFVWCSEAYIYEIVSPERQSLSLELDRQYNNGYLFVFKAKKLGKFKKTKALIKILADTCLFAFLTLISIGFLKDRNNIFLLSLFKNIGKLKSVFTETPYQHYRKD